MAPGLLADMRQLYTAAGYAPLWTTAAGWQPLAVEGLRLLARAPEFGLLPADYGCSSLSQLTDSLAMPAPPVRQLARRLRADLALSRGLLLFSRHLRHGRVESRPLPAFSAAGRFDAAAGLEQAHRRERLDVLLAQQPTNRSYVRLLWAWQKMLRADTAAARRWAPLVAINLERLRWEPAADSVYAVVNVPDYSLQIVRGPRVVRRFRVIVGEALTPTPEVYSAIRFFETSPEWRVPRSIATGEILPQLRRNPAYLARNNFLLYDAKGSLVNPKGVNWKSVTVESFPYSIRQVACCDNALGNIVFRFPNPHDIFLHDTPTRALFNKSGRALSHGCIRLEKPLQLAVFLLRRDLADQPKRAQRNVERMWDSVYGGYRQYFPLRYPMPIFIRYLTCEADGPELRRLPDVYGRDEALRAAFFGRALVAQEVSVGH
ncbi:L,D-transpeptidase family protein [Hymenobacter sp. B81]|uniref:L,D-transpeptidase family protein n=1 Tax=Hymenobacter sp. B81 TaxID=3344878 RepID=UPI0037DC518F